MGTLNRSREPAVVSTASGEVHIHEEVQVFVRDLDEFVTVQLLEETLAVLSLSKLCKDHGYSSEWDSGQEPRSTPRWWRALSAKTDNFVPLVFPGLSVNSGSDSSSTSTIAGLIETGSRPSSWKQSCIDLIFKLRIWAKWRTSHQETGTGIPENPKPKEKEGWQEGCGWSVGRSSVLVRGFQR